MVYLGTKEILGRMKLLEGKVLVPGESALAQFHFKEEIAVCIGDRFVIRRPSPATTIGGGTVLDPLASRYNLKDIAKVIFSLQRRETLKIDDLILSELDKDKYTKVEDFLIASKYSSAEINDCVRILQNENKLIIIGSWVIDSPYWSKQVDEALNILSREHSFCPLKEGLPQAELQNHLGLPNEIFNGLIATLINSEKIVREKDTIALSTHKPQLSPEEGSVVSRILELFERDRANPPTKRELLIQIPNSEEIVQFMCRQNMLVELPEEVLFEHKHYEVVKNEIISFLKRNNSISIQEVRKLFGFSRKYILPLLSKLDQEGITQRHGDERVLVQKHY